MTPTTEQLKEIMCVYGNTHPCYLAAAECLANREAQGTAVGMQYRVQVPNVTGWSLWHNGDSDKYREHYDVQQRLVYAAPPAPAVPDFGALTKLIVDRLIDCSASDDDSIADAEEFVYNACRAAMLAQPVSQGCNWVACSERMPEYGKDVKCIALTQKSNL